MKTFTVYDNVNGGYTVRYRRYDYNERVYKTNTYHCNNENSMKSFTDKLKKDGYKFVGKII